MAIHINGASIAALRAAQGWSQAGFARAIEVHRGHLHHIESGQKSPSPELAKRIARSLGVPLAAILATPIAHKALEDDTGSAA